VNRGALGIIEARGFVGIVEGVDAMLKAAQVSIVGYEKIGAGILAVCIQGDVGAVRVAVDAGANAASKAGGDVRAVVIANPNPGLSALLEKGR
jgi:ethanolamine utilization protein EutM